ncbi:MAG: glycosyltransferase family 4 protein [Candidatus Sedimenticola endophacoides]
MRIGLISADFAPNVGGVAAHVVELGTTLSKLGHDVHVITLPLGGARERISSWRGMTVHRPHIPKAKPFYSWLLHRWIVKFLNQNKLDILHVHGLRPLEATHNLPVPVIFTNHTSGFLKRIQKGSSERNRMGNRLSHVSHILAPSEELCEASRKAGYNGPITFIPNGVDADRFSPGIGKLRSRLNIPNTHIIVLLARRLVEKNGVVVFAEATAQLHDLPITLLFAGTGPEQSRVESILRKNGLFARAIFLGNIDNSEMPMVYNSADISVLPSFMEATSITGLESMACGLPLVGTCVGGIPDLIDDEKTGLLIEPRNPEILGNAIKRLAMDAELRKALGNNARRCAEEKFSWDKIAGDTVSIYRQHGQ